MMLGYTRNLKTLWGILDLEFRKVTAQLEVAINEERNGHMSCRHGSNVIDMFRLPEDEEHIKESDTGEEPLRDS